MAWTQQDIDNLKAAIAKGTRSVSIHGRTVTYHSLDEMRKLLEMMEAEVNPPRRRSTVAVFRRT